MCAVTAQISVPSYICQPTYFNREFYISGALASKSSTINRDHHPKLPNITEHYPTSPPSTHRHPASPATTHFNPTSPITTCHHPPTIITTHYHLSSSILSITARRLTSSLTSTYPLLPTISYCCKSIGLYSATWNQIATNRNKY